VFPGQTAASSGTLLTALKAGEFRCAGVLSTTRSAFHLVSSSTSKLQPAIAGETARFRLEFWSVKNRFELFLQLASLRRVLGRNHVEDGAVIQTTKLTKRFGNQYALNGVDLTVNPGAIGLLGPNGAGKSTLIKCLLQLQKITSGGAKLLGRDVSREGRDIRTKVGYTPEQDCHIPGMVGCEYVTYCAQLCGLPFENARQRAHETLDFVGMGQERYRKIDSYSTGMKQRVKIAQAIVHDPQIVFLDEPTNGLDPKGQAQILDLIQNLWKEHQMTVVLSSHLLHDVDRICEQIVIIGKGKVLVHDSLENLKARRAGAAEVVVPDRHGELIAACEKRGWKSSVETNGHIKVDHRSENLNELIRLMDELKITPLEIIPSPNALQEMFVQALRIGNAAD
jgi:ABC-2 type transport system ATP-binding protein